MPQPVDGPASGLFSFVEYVTGTSLEDIRKIPLSEKLIEALPHAPMGDCVCRGIPFRIGDIAVVRDKPVTVSFSPVKARWFVFLHTADLRELPPNENGLFPPTLSERAPGEELARYHVLYDDGSHESSSVRRQRQIGAFAIRWGEISCFEAVVHFKPFSIFPSKNQTHTAWGKSQTRGSSGSKVPWTCWLWAWENPHPEKEVKGLRIEPVGGTVLLMGLSAGSPSSHPLRWESRKKALMELPEGEEFAFEPDERGRYEGIELDMGQIISAEFQKNYPNKQWEDSDNNQLPEVSETAVLLEYTAQPDASFHLKNGTVVPLTSLAGGSKERSSVPLRRVEDAVFKVKL